MHFMYQAPVLVAVALAAAACTEPDEPGAQTEYGVAVSVGNGEARSYIITEQGVPAEIGIALTEAALEGLPGGTGPMDAHSFLLPLPANNQTGYQIAELNWNPAGHPPPMVYTVPHFDVHFYTVSLAERNAITPADPQFGAKAANFPVVDLRPTGYISPLINGQPDAVPAMGVHWISPAAPEFHGSAFTSTFIYGSWDGHFTFVEPMVALDFLKTKPDIEPTIPVPAHFDTEGYRPTGYRVRFDEASGEYRVGLTGLRLIPAG